jgi:uncharacterized protein
MTDMPQSTSYILSLRYGFVASAIAAALAMPAAIAGAQSFDCRAARTADELIICQNGDLARLDQQLAAAYRRDLATLGPEQRDQFQHNEVAFLNARRRCGEDYRCIAQSYRNRILELQNLTSTGNARDGAGNAASVGDQPERRSEPRDIRRTGSQRPPETSGSISPDRPSEVSGSTVPERRSEPTVIAVPEQRQEASPSGSSLRQRVEPSVNATLERHPEPSSSTSTERRLEPSGNANGAKDQATESTPPTPKPHHATKRQQPAAAKDATTEASTPPAASVSLATAAASPQASTSGPAKPVIRWADPPPAR